MSHLLYQTRLHWQRGRGGIAKLHGREQRLDSHLCPVEALPATCVLLEYAPEVGAAYLQTAHEPKRDLSSIEIRACDLLLRTLCAPK